MNQNDRQVIGGFFILTLAVIIISFIVINMHIDNVRNEIMQEIHSGVVE